MIMKKLLACLVLVSSLLGCAAHHRCGFDSPRGAVYVGSDVYYRPVDINGVPHRFYYRWTRSQGWRYDHTVWSEDR
jgi:hypothetical protein